MGNKYVPHKSFVPYSLPSVRLWAIHFGRTQLKTGLAEGRTEKARQNLLKDVSTNPEVLELMTDGYEAFAEWVAERLIREQPDDIFLNVCPKYGALTRTPTAKQCPDCFHAWHEIQ